MMRNLSVGLFLICSEFFLVCLQLEMFKKINFLVDYFCIDFGFV